MLEWLAANIGTIIVALIVIAVVSFLVSPNGKRQKRGQILLRCKLCALCVSR